MLDVKKLLTKVLTTGSRSFSSNGTVVIRKQLNLVTVIYQGSAKAYTRGAYSTVFTLNADERPSTPVYFTAYDNNTADIAKVPLAGRIETNGNVNVWIYSGSGTNVAPYFHVTFLR